ncbi:MAG: chemotaxis protein CheA, partial [Halobacteriovoraceae bacterium]|nr:chemotaxis protein CheA [Halobacteriovoraceae bacterium]
MSATDPMVDEFFIEALSLLDEAEDGLICYEKGEATEESYNCIYRAFHSVKGGAGMFEVTDLQGHLHHLENLFGKVKELGEIPTDLIDYFLKGVDAARDR